MPASYVHQSVARSAMLRLGMPLSGQTEAAFFSGCEGPDPLFYAFYRVWQAKYPPRAGIMMHREETEGFLTALLTEAVSPEEIAYARGFLTHYAADTVFHPFVYGHSLTEDGSYSSSQHGIIEHAYEIVRYRRDGNPDGIPEQMAGLARLSDSTRASLASLFSKAMQRTYTRFLVTPNQMEHIFKGSVRVARKLASPNGRKYRVIGAMPFKIDRLGHAHMIPVEPPEKDLWNDAHEAWSSIFEPDMIRHESMDDLYLTAIDRSCELIQGADRFREGRMDAEAFIALLGSLSYDSGLPWRTTPLPQEAPGCRKKATEGTQSNS